MVRRHLTVKQLRIFQYIVQYMGHHRQAPYIREIQAACQIVSYKSVVDKLVALEKKGYIRRALNRHRGIFLAGPVPQELMGSGDGSSEAQVLPVPAPSPEFGHP